MESNKLLTVSAGGLSDLTFDDDDCTAYEALVSLYAPGNCETVFENKNTLFKQALVVLQCGLLVMESQVDEITELNSSGSLDEELELALSLGRHFRPVSALSAQSSRYAPILLLNATSVSEEQQENIDAINSIADLKEGDTLYYEGKQCCYLGVQTINVADQELSMLVLQHDAVVEREINNKKVKQQETSKLLVPEASLNKVTRTLNTSSKQETLELVKSLLEYDCDIPCRATKELGLDVPFVNGIDQVDAEGKLTGETLTSSSANTQSAKQADKLFKKLSDCQYIQFAADDNSVYCENVPNIIAGRTPQGHIIGLLFNFVD